MRLPPSPHYRRPSSWSPLLRFIDVGASTPTFGRVNSEQHGPYTMSNPAMVSLVGAKRVHTQPIPNIIDARSRLQRSLEEYRRAEAHRTWPWQDQVSAKLPGMCSYAALPPQLKSDLASLTNFILDCTAHAIAEKQVVVLMRIVAAALSQLRQKPAAVTGDWQCTSCHSDVRMYVSPSSGGRLSCVNHSGRRICLSLT